VERFSDVDSRRFAGGPSRIGMDADLSLRRKGLVMPILDESRPSPAINISRPFR
jgi:hypothetical protein